MLEGRDRLVVSAFALWIASAGVLEPRRAAVMRAMSGPRTQRGERAGETGAFPRWAIGCPVFPRGNTGGRCFAQHSARPGWAVDRRRCTPDEFSARLVFPDFIDTVNGEPIAASAMVSLRISTVDTP